MTPLPWNRRDKLANTQKLFVDYSFLEIDTFLGKQRPIFNKMIKNQQDACSKNPGRVFSEGAEPPEAITTPRTARGDPKTGKNVND